jgi:hypothetical protein
MVMIKHREAQVAFQSERADSVKEDIFVNITLYRVPGDLVQKFTRNVVVNYPGGLSEAVQDLMRKALKE